MSQGPISRAAQGLCDFRRQKERWLSQIVGLWILFFLVTRWMLYGMDDAKCPEKR